MPKEELKESSKSKTDLAEKETKKQINVSDLIQPIFDSYGQSGNETLQSKAREAINQFLVKKSQEYKILENYNTLVLFDSGTMVRSDADNIYSAVRSFKDKKPLLLILYSKGGAIGSAYLIGKLCRECSNDKFFKIVVPRQAKSAATLLCCAADEIHMGSLSELGPIDPQIDKLPALGLKNSVEHIAQLVKETPESATMFAQYLHLSLKPIDLGYYERIAVSAEQYAIRLLEYNKAKLPRNPSQIAHKLVYEYKDHGFVIDKGEALAIFSDDIIKTDTPEYEYGNNLYKDLSLIEYWFSILGYHFYLIGSLDTSPIITKRN